MSKRPQTRAAKARMAPPHKAAVPSCQLSGWSAIKPASPGARSRSDAAGANAHAERQRSLSPQQSCGREAPRLLDQNAQLPFRNTGSSFPSAVTPKISISAEPIIKSTWVRLRFRPLALSSSCVMDLPPFRQKA